MKRFLRSLGQDTRGATALEYGLILGLIVLVVFIGIKGMAGESGGTWSAISTKSVNAMKAA